MKKLMFAAAVVAAAFGLKAELASANVVGYTTTNVRSGYTLLIPSFDDIGSDGLDIQKIKPQTEVAGIGLQTFTDSAELDTMYYYVPAGKAGAGWYTNARGSANNYAVKSFLKGEVFRVYMPQSGIELNVSGEVSLAEKKIENVRSGYTLMGNFRPVSYDIQKIKPSTDAAGVGLQTFTDSAELDTMYYYVPAGKAGAGWYTNARGSANNYAVKSFDPGEGFMIYLPSSMDVTFQAAE